MPDAFIGLAAVVLIFSIPIVAILVKHQQKMAELVRMEQPQQSDELAGEVYRLRMEVERLKETVYASVLAQEMTTPPPLQDRLETRQDG